MSGKNLTWELVHDEQIVKDRWMDMKAATYRLPDGREVGPFYHYSRKDFVVIVAVDENGDFVCVRQFRQGIGRITTEFPAGGLEEGESPLDAAKRELAEAFMAGDRERANLASRRAYGLEEANA